MRLVVCIFGAALALNGGANDEDTSASPFGHAILKDFSFPKDWTNLNQGSYGACPIPVQNARSKVVQTIDNNPEVFFRGNIDGSGRTIYSDLVDESRRAVAEYVGANTNNIVLVDNASSGLDIII